MERIFKHNANDLDREVTPFERSVLETPAEEVPAAGEAAEYLDPETLRASVISDALAEARREAEHKVNEAYEQGLARGIAAGEERFRESLAECEQALRGTAEAMRAAYQEFLDSLEPEVFELVRLVAERVLDRELRQDTQAIHATLRRALACIADRAHLTVRLHPDDLTAVREHKVTLLEEFEAVKHLDLAPDPDLSPGSCVVDSERMHVDARLETLLENVLNELAD